MKAKDSSWPRVVKNGSAVVRIYKTSSRGYPLFQVSDFSQGSRRLRSFADEGEALTEAARIARPIANGQTTAAAMRNPDAASFGRAMEILRPTGDSIELAASRYAEVVKLLGAGDRLIESVKYFLANDPGNLPDRDVASVVEEFTEHRKARGKSDRYVKDLESRLGRFRDTFRVKLASVRGSELQAFLDGLKGSQQTIKNYHAVLGTLFSFAKARGYIRHNPIDDTERVSPSTDGAVEIYTPKELGKLLSPATRCARPPL